MSDYGRSLPFWEKIGHQLRRPEGRAGAFVGRLMAILNREPYRRAIEALDLHPGDDVLDIGFGPGLGFGLLASRAPLGRIAGIDHSAEMLKQAARRNHAAIAAGRLELVRGSFGALPWCDASFDKILLVNAVYFFDRSGQDMSEAHRVLRVGGRIAVYATDRATMQHWPFSSARTHRTFDADALAALLVDGGFDRARIEIRPLSLPLGMKGTIAVACKDTPSLPGWALALPAGEPAAGS